MTAEKNSTFFSKMEVQTEWSALANISISNKPPKI